MTHTRPSGLLLAGLLLLHLLVAGGAFARGMPGGGAMADMGMSMSDMSGRMVSESGSAPEEMPCPEPAPCDVPGMPGGCPSTAACAPVIIAPAPQDLAFSLVRAVRPTGAVGRAPHTRTSPPELPPPRA